MVSRFRVKKLSPKHPLPVYKESQLPDITDASNVQRAVPQIETGVEKEEEEEVIYTITHSFTHTTRPYTHKHTHTYIRTISFLAPSCSLFLGGGLLAHFTIHFFCAPILCSPIFISHGVLIYLSLTHNITHYLVA